MPRATGGQPFSSHRQTVATAEIENLIHGSKFASLSVAWLDLQPPGGRAVRCAAHRIYSNRMGGAHLGEDDAGAGSEGPISYALKEITPWCTREPSLPWAWDDKSDWLPEVTPGTEAMRGWSVPDELQEYESQIEEQCPWMYDTTHFSAWYMCLDGTECRGLKCCHEHSNSNTAMCPPDRPNMCAGIPGDAETFCVNMRHTIDAMDHSCETWDCRPRIRSTLVKRRRVDCDHAI